jgi:hypothetical protein
MKTLFLAALILAAPAAVYAADQPGPPAAKAAIEGAKTKERKVCVEQVKTGSLFKEQVCKTPAEWDALEAQAKETTSNWSRMSGGRYSGGADGGGGVRSGVGIGGQ